MKRGLHFDSDWPVVLVFGLMVAFILGLTPTGHKMRSELLKLIALESAGQRSHDTRPDVLVATANFDDQKTVAGTVVPRGYNVLFADTTAVALQLLQSDANRIGLIVVDAKCDARAIGNLARSLVPNARLIKLPPRHGSTEVATLLLAAI